VLKLTVEFVTLANTSNNSSKQYHTSNEYLETRRISLAALFVVFKNDEFFFFVFSSFPGNMSSCRD
jgi:hypothetical protein